MSINKLSHTSWKCKYHIVFSPKYRRQVIYNQIKSLSTNKLILIAPCAILSSRKNNGGKHGNDKAENMGNNG